MFREAQLHYKLFQGRPPTGEIQPMFIMVVYVLIVLVSESIVVGIGLILDRIYPVLSLPVSLTLFFAVFWLGWKLSVHLTDPKRVKRIRPSNKTA
jgi:uncharacterized membrane protein YphA (DoxX/SURF4 family)